MSPLNQGRGLAVLAVATWLAACGSASINTINGKVSDQTGTQQQGLSSPTTGGFGGTSTVSSSTQVQVMALGSTGELTSLATGTISASGTYSVEVPSGTDRVVVQALDAQGNVVAQAIVESTGASGAQVVASPMTSETSVEAAILVEMVQRGSSLAATNAVDLRARINSQVAASVKASSDPEASVRGLADAVIAAQKSQTESYEASGHAVTQEQLFRAQLEAAAALNAALDRGDAADSAYATFHQDMAAARQSLGIAAKSEAKSEGSASSSFRATVSARLSGDAVADAASRQAAAYEAIAVTAAVDAALSAAGAADATLTSASAAATALKTSLANATTVSACVQAYASYSASIEGSGTVTGSILGDFLEVNGITAASVDAAIAAQVSASVALASSLDAAFSTLLSVTGIVNFTSLATSVVDAYGTYEAAVQAQAATLVTFGAKANAAVDVMVAVGGAFH